MEWSDIQASAVAVPEHVAFRALAQETVLLDIRAGQYHGLDTIGARFFTVMCESPSLEAAAATLATEYGQPPERIQADLTAFVEQMLSRNLLQLRQP